ERARPPGKTGGGARRPLAVMVDACVNWPTAKDEVGRFWSECRSALCAPRRRTMPGHAIPDAMPGPATTRRAFVKAGLAAMAAATTPRRLAAETAASAANTIRAVMHGDLTVLDPIWTTANMTAYHGAMLYDTLFGIDANLETKPQMVSKWAPSEDKKTWTFELRDGLKFSDGVAVTSDDVIASLRPWAARDAAGQHMMQRVSDIAKKDDKTSQFILKDPYGYLVDALGKTSTPLCYIMRKKEAETNPMEKITAYVGSGPFLFNEAETRQGARYVYDRNPNYVPRSEPASGLAGGKVAKV